jgi:hypothetical protein
LLELTGKTHSYKVSESFVFLSVNKFTHSWQGFELQEAIKLN